MNILITNTSKLTPPIYSVNNLIKLKLSTKRGLGYIQFKQEFVKQDKLFNSKLNIPKSQLVFTRISITFLN
jgi:hypothetical protein